MSRLVIAAVAVAALGLAPAAARASVTSSNITSWVSSQPGTPANDPYLISYDNPPATTLVVSGGAPGANDGDQVDVLCFYGSGGKSVKFATATIQGQAFTTAPTALQKLAGHACRLRAVPSGSTVENAASFTGPTIAVSEAEAVAIGTGPNAGRPYNFYLNGTTLSGFTAWSAAGTPAQTINLNACGGPNLAPIDSSLNIGNTALDCVGSLLSDDLGASGGRSEVQVDGRSAYDAASAQSLFAPAGGNPPSQNLTGFPALSTSVNWNPTNGLVSSSSKESWAACNGPNAEKPTFATCSSFVTTGVQLERDISASDGGRVVTMTDTWSSADGAAHAIDLLYDDFVGLAGSTTTRGYEFPGQSAFSPYSTGDAVPGPASAPGSILVSTNVNAADGDPAEAVGAITFSKAPSDFRFAGEDEFEEHQVLQVPPGGATRLTYIYSTDYSVANVVALALAAQDRIQSPAIAISSPANGTVVSTPSVAVTGQVGAGSGIASLVVSGQPVSVGTGGAWSAQVPLNPGANLITALATDRTGATVQSQVTISYQPPPAAPAPPPPSRVRCRVPRAKGMKLPAAEKAVRRAHCRVGKVKKTRSRKVRKGRVMHTKPAAGRKLPAGSKIELFVSKGW